MRSAIGLQLILLVFLTETRAFSAADIQVASLPALESAIAIASPGDRIILADGQYSSRGQITIVATGSEERPIVIAAKTVGRVEIRGEAGFRLKSPAAYIVIQGFVFTHKAGEMKLEYGVHHCRITRNVFELAVTGGARYLAVAGDDIEIDHNTFRNKDSEGQMLQVTGPRTQEMAQRTWIHHNYFHDFKRSRRNNSSALHIGHSSRSMSSAYTVVEKNLFIRTEGENEGAICNKASDTIYRFNSFGEGSSELSLRHGKRCLVYGNFFLGGHGLRFFSHDHRIFSNYFADCRPAISIGNGGATIPPGRLTSHERPERVHIVYNTLVNNRSNVQMDRRRNGLGATDLVFANNVIVGGRKAVSLDGPLTNPKWEGNILWDNEGGPGDIPASGFTAVDPLLVPGEGVGYKIRETSPAIGRGVGSYPYVMVDVEGQPRSTAKDVGADQLSNRLETNHVLNVADVGPGAPMDERPWISAPKHVEWIPKREDASVP